MCRQSTIALAPASDNAHKLAAALARRLERMACLGEDRSEPSLFDSAEVPSISVHDYTMRLLARFGCSAECIAVAFVYIDRFVAADAKRGVSFRSVHRLLLTAVVIAAKWQDDVHYTNRAYAKVGGISGQELNLLESALIGTLGWRLHVSHNEFEDTVAHVFGHQGQRSARECERKAHCSAMPKTRVFLDLVGA